MQVRNIPMGLQDYLYDNGRFGCAFEDDLKSIGFKGYVIDLAERLGMIRKETFPGGRVNIADARDHLYVGMGLAAMEGI